MLLIFLKCDRGFSFVRILIYIIIIKLCVKYIMHACYDDNAYDDLNRNYAC